MPLKKARAGQSGWAGPRCLSPDSRRTRGSHRATGEHPPSSASSRECPGVGKTALAVHAARIMSVRNPGGVLYLNLHSHDLAIPPLDGGEALLRLLRMLTGPATQIPDAPAERAALWRAAHPSPCRGGPRRHRLAGPDRPAAARRERVAGPDHKPPPDFRPDCHADADLGRAARLMMRSRCSAGSPGMLPPATRARSPRLWNRAGGCRWRSSSRRAGWPRITRCGPAGWWPGCRDRLRPSAPRRRSRNGCPPLSCLTTPWRRATRS